MRGDAGPWQSIAILDDYQNVALKMADWSRLQQGHRVVVLNQHLPDVEACARALADFEVIGVMRERTPFPRALIERLPKLKLLVTTGKRNASIDVAAAKERGVTVCGTSGGAHPTAELAIGLMLGLARHLREEFHAMRAGGGWQSTVGFDLDGRTLGILGPRQPRRQGGAHRRRLRHEADRLEREPHARARQGARRRARRARTSCSAAPT